MKHELVRQILQNYSAAGENIDCISLMKKLASVEMDKWLKEMQ
jgi:hypothetical protein